MDILEKIFGGKEKVKIMRFFLFHPSESFYVKDIAQRIDVEARALVKFLASFERIGFLKRIKGKTNNHLSQAFALAKDFPLTVPMRNLLINTSLLSDKEILKRLRVVGKLKLLIVSGVFNNDEESRLDVLFVGDAIRDGAVRKAIRALEIEIGKEIRYAYFETPDFYYRYDMYDKLIMDVLQFPHRKIVNKLEI